MLAVCCALRERCCESNLKSSVCLRRATPLASGNRRLVILELLGSNLAYSGVLNRAGSDRIIELYMVAPPTGLI